MPEYRYRDAATGRYVTEEYALAHPETTISEEVTPGGPSTEELVGYPYLDPITLDSPLNLYRAWLDYQISNNDLNTNEIWVHANDENEFAQDDAMTAAMGEVTEAGRQPRFN